MDCARKPLGGTESGTVPEAICVSRIDKDAKEARDERIFDMWLACWTQEEIAKKENVSQPTVAALLSEFPDLEKLIKAEKAAAEHATDFEVPLYNVWKQADEVEYRIATKSA